MKHFTAILSCTASVVLLGGLSLGLAKEPIRTPPADPTKAAHPPAAKVAPAEALTKLKDGNKRFVAGKLQHPRQNPRRRTELANGQSPFAIVLGCADSRTSPEVVFDQGLGDVFVLRVAGNVLNDETIGSIEYAVEHLGTALIVVLGHERCGAVKAAKETIAAGGEAPGHVQSLVKAIRPAVEATKDGDVEATCKRNVQDVVRALQASAPILKGKVDAGAVAVVGGHLDLDTGSVEFLK